MYSKYMLIGILLSCARFKLIIFHNEKAKLGYSIKYSLEIRGEKEFLKGIERSLAMQGITTLFKETESSTRGRPLLKITGKDNLLKVKNLIPDLPDRNNNLKDFKQTMHIINKNRHKTLEGLEVLMKIKGVL
jgi:hypothetical protein